MGIEKNGGYAGPHLMPDGQTKVMIAYFDVATTRRLFNQGISRDDVRYKTIGWYWSHYSGVPTSATSWRGPFNASRSALRNAEVEFPAEEDVA